MLKKGFFPPASNGDRFWQHAVCAPRVGRKTLEGGARLEDGVLLVPDCRKLRQEIIRSTCMDPIGRLRPDYVAYIGENPRWISNGRLRCGLALAATIRFTFAYRASLDFAPEVSFDSA